MIFEIEIILLKTIAILVEASNQFTFPFPTKELEATSPMIQPTREK